MTKVTVFVIRKYYSDQDLFAYRHNKGEPISLVVELIYLRLEI